MNRDLKNFLDRKMAFQEPAGAGKIMTLPEAVRKFIRRGMSIHQGNGMVVPAPIYYEIARQFWGKDPRFTLIAISGGAYSFTIFAFGKLIRKVISAFNGDGYPFPSPNPILSRAYQDGTVQIENCTQLTIMLRLIAGSMGIPFFPTQSIAGSSMETEHPESFRKMDNPFASNESVGLVRALNPDISIAHGLAADPDGNTILAVPFSGNHYGALAAREGTIVTVERIVDRDYIRRHSGMAMIPGYAVRAVCPLPLGGHPSGLHHQGVQGIEGYGEDVEFIMDARKASRKPEDYQAWLDKWVLGCPDHEEYLARLGQKRIWYLKGRIHNDAWTSELAEHSGGLAEPGKATQAEMIVSAASRKLSEIIRRKNHRLVLCGIGVSNLASWVSYYDLRREGYPVELVAEIGYYGYAPQPGDPAVFNLRNIPSCRNVTDTLTILGVMMGGPAASKLGVLGAGQIDRFGNINTTRFEDGSYLVGSGGANDVASGADETVVALEQNRNRFVEKVPFITSPGTKVSTVVSQMGVFEKEPGRLELELTAYIPAGPGASEEESVRAIKDQCGWELKVRGSLQKLSPPTGEDLRFMRCFDPQRLFLGK